MIKTLLSKKVHQLLNNGPGNSFFWGRKNTVLEPYNSKNDLTDQIELYGTADTILWEYEIDGRKLNWSDGFYHLFGYVVGQADSSYDHFVNNLLYHGDRSLFLDLIQDAGTPQLTEVRLFTGQGYQWFAIAVHKRSAAVLSGTLTDIHTHKLSALDAKLKQQHEAMADHLAGLARWEIDIATGGLKLSAGGYQLLELQQETVMTVDELISFYEPDHRPVIQHDIEACMQYGRPFDVDLKIRSVRNNCIWVKTKALAILDDRGRCVAVTGIIQDIDKARQQQTELTRLLRASQDQNKRLQSFAHVVSHNLRSYSTNLGTIVNFYEEAEDEQERSETFGRIKTISNSLSSVIGHLNEIVKVEFDIKKLRTEVAIEPLFVSIINSLQGDIRAIGADITFDFTACPSVSYLHAYLESIMHNLLSNALKYRHPGRLCKIVCKSFKEKGHTYFTIRDNGIGIDLEKHKDKIFGMYQTFHQHPDANGIGLFLIRNQIEALGGRITIESTVNVGTKFTVQLT